MDNMTKHQPPASIAIHIHAIRWALAQGYSISVTDLCCDEGEWDCEYSTDEAEIIDCCSATDIPNAYIFEKVGDGYNHLSTFSVIDEGVPSETINDYTCGPLSQGFDEAMDSFYDYYR